MEEVKKENTESKDIESKTYDEDIQMDTAGKHYSFDGLIDGIVRFSNFTGSGFDQGGGIGSGNRAKVIKELGFSDRPSKAECDAAVTTINIEAYPGRRITVHKSLVNEVQDIFRRLKQAGVQLNSNIGGYCYRAINNPSKPGCPTLSMHSFGCAIDINYDLNPFVAHGKPLDSGDETSKGKVRTMNSPIVKAFAANGWGWGGRYGDYMHFSKANGG